MRYATASTRCLALEIFRASDYVILEPCNVDSLHGEWSEEAAV